MEQIDVSLKYLLKKQIYAPSMFEVLFNQTKT